VTDKPLSKLGITGVTVSVEIADKNYGSGQSDFMSVSSRIPDGMPGLPMDMDTVIGDGLDKYFAAWQTLLQAALASGRIDQADYMEQTRRFLTRVEKVRVLYRKMVKAEAV